MQLFASGYISFLFYVLDHIQKAQNGYEHVIEWIHTEAPRPLSETENLSKNEPLDDEDELGDADRIDGVGDFVSVPELDDQQHRMEQVCIKFDKFRI